MKKIFISIMILTLTLIIFSCGLNQTTVTSTITTTLETTTEELYLKLNVDLETYAELINYLDVFEYNVEMLDINDKFSLLRDGNGNYFLFDKENHTLTDLSVTLNATQDSLGTFIIRNVYNPVLKVAFVYSETVWIKITETAVGEPNITETGEIIGSMYLTNDNTSYYIKKYNKEAGYKESMYMEIRNIFDDQVITQMDNLNYVNHGLYVVPGEYFAEFYQLLNGELQKITSTTIPINGWKNSIKNDILMIEGITDTFYNTFYFFKILETGEITYLKSNIGIDGYFLSDNIILKKDTQYKVYNLSLELLKTLDIPEEAENAECMPIDGTYYVKLTSDKIGIYHYGGQLVSELDLEFEEHLKFVQVLMEGSDALQTYGSYSIQTSDSKYKFNGVILLKVEEVLIPHRYISLVEEAGEIKIYSHFFETPEELFLAEVIEIVKNEDINFDNVYFKYFDGMVTVLIVGRQEDKSNIFIYIDNELQLSGQMLGHIFERDILILTEAGKVVCFDSEEPNKN